MLRVTRTMVTLGALQAAAWLVAIPPATPAYAESAQEILQRQRELHHVPDETETLKMTMVNKNGETKEREVVRDTITGPDNLSKILIRFTAPRDVQGTGMLIWEKADGDDDQWLYLPAMRKVKRIAASGKKNRFMGTDFAYEDLSPESLRANTYTLVGNETIDGAECWVVEAVPASEAYAADSGYSKRKLWIRQDNYVTVKREYYDKQGKLEKVQDDRKFSKVAETAWRSDEVEMRDVQAGTKTIFVTQGHKIAQGLSDDRFSLTELEEGAE